MAGQAAARGAAHRRGVRALPGARLHARALGRGDHRRGHGRVGRPRQAHRAAARKSPTSSRPRTTRRSSASSTRSSRRRCARAPPTCTSRSSSRARWCATASTARCATWSSRARGLHPGDGLAHQGHGLARHRREAPAAGRPHRAAHRGARRSTCASPRFRPAAASAWCCACSTSRPGASRSTRSAWPPPTRDAIDALIHAPHGIFLVTGPTGSGKTTTLYSALSRLDRKTRNILTVEDPIEYELDGVGQTQVNPRIEMTFARALRAILRQDPDVVMIGEIRDLETAQIAVQASLTGHLVLATLHTNDAPGRRHAPHRHGHRAVPARLHAERRARAAPGAQALRRVPRALRAGRAPSARSSGDDGARAPLPRGGLRRLQLLRLPRPHRHLRAAAPPTTTLRHLHPRHRAGERAARARGAPRHDAPARRRPALGARGRDVARRSLARHAH